MLNLVRSGPNNSRRDEALLLRPNSRLVLRLPKIEDRDAVGVNGIVGWTNRLCLIARCATIKAGDPRSRTGAAVVTETQPLCDFYEVGLRRAGNRARAVRVSSEECRAERANCHYPFLQVFFSRRSKMVMNSTKRVRTKLLKLRVLFSFSDVRQCARCNSLKAETAVRFPRERQQTQVLR